MLLLRTERLLLNMNNKTYEAFDLTKIPLTKYLFLPVKAVLVKHLQPVQ